MSPAPSACQSFWSRTSAFLSDEMDWHSLGLVHPIFLRYPGHCTVLSYRRNECSERAAMGRSVALSLFFARVNTINGVGVAVGTDIISCMVVIIDL